MDQRFRITGFYEDSVVANRWKGWNTIRQLKARSDLPGRLEGQMQIFNEITSREEKRGGVERLEGQMQIFHDALDYCELKDLGYQGPKYTWDGTRAGGLRSDAGWTVL